MTLATRGFWRAASTRPNIELVDDFRRPLVEIFGCIAGLWNVRPAMAGIIEGVDGKALRQLRDDALEDIELRSERV